MSAVIPPAYQNVIGIITDAMYDAGKLRLGDEPGSEDLAKHMRSLNKIILYLLTKGCKLFQLQDTAIPITANQALYTLGPGGTQVIIPKPYRVISGYYLYTSGDQYPLTPMSYPNEYLMLSQLNSMGAINSYAVNKQAATLDVYFWNTPDSYAVTNGVPHLMLQVAMPQFTGVTDTMLFPSEWSLALEWILADQLSVGKPIAVIGRNSANAKRYQEDLENWDVEDADTIFQPDQRINQNTGRFR